MTFAFILAAALVTSSAPATTGAEAPPLVISVAAPQATDTVDASCSDADTDLDTEWQPINFPENYLAPVEPICSTWCEDERVFCCVDPDETCGYTCVMQYIRCSSDCRLGNPGR